MTPKTAKDFYSFVPMKDLYVPNIDHSKYYPNASVKSAIYRYKVGNYTGCLQELYSYISNPKHINDAYAYYYIAIMFKNGLYVKANRDSLRFYLQKAKDYGNEDALIMYENEF
jgi:TPR repeat protein